MVWMVEKKIVHHVLDMGFEQVEIVEKAKAMPDEEALQFLSWMKQEYGKILPTDEVMIAQIKMYLALRELVEEKGYDFIAVKCLT